jgi:hypothetical protein
VQGHSRQTAALVILLASIVHRPATAQGPRPDDRAWSVRSTGRLTVDGGFVMASPAALGTGFSTGVGAGASFGRVLAWGLRASWSTATESSLPWTVTQADLKLRATAAIQRDVGRGKLALRLGLGPTIVHETRLRNQGMRAGLIGNELQTSSFSTLPGADLEAMVTVHIAGRWLLTTSGGPSMTLLDGKARAGWTAQIGAGWQP